MKDILNRIARWQVLRQSMMKALRIAVVPCSGERCRRIAISYPLLRAHKGILLSGSWYCSSSCLQDALAAELALLATAYPSTTQRAPRFPLHSILLVQGLITKQQLERARAATHLYGDLGQALIGLGYLSETQAGRARAEEMGVPFYPYEGQPVPLGCRLPLTLMRQYQAVPMHHVGETTGGRLLIGFVSRIDRNLLRAAQTVLGCKVEACFITLSQYRQQEERARVMLHYKETGKDLRTARDMIDSVTEQALSSHAERVQVGRAGTILWVRLSGSASIVDVVVDLGGTLRREAPEFPAIPEGGAIYFPAQQQKSGREADR